MNKETTILEAAQALFGERVQRNHGEISKATGAARHHFLSLQE
jgi:hypothetical protein